MASRVNPSQRGYDSSGRRRQAAATRAAVIDAARSSFLEHGYAAASIPAIARAAGVSAELVYKTIGPKPALLKAVIDTSVTGDDEPVALQERPAILRLKAMTDTAQILDAYAEVAVQVMTRLAPIYRLGREAAAAEPAAGTVVAQLNSERLTGMTAMAAQLTSLGELKPELTKAEVRDILWTYNSPELYELLVLNREWSTNRYLQFLREALRAAFLWHT
jgi:AcrR family transcriptional regulator